MNSKWKNAVSFVKEMIVIYSEKRVPRSAAELSYFLTMSIFPFLIVLHAMIVKFIPGLSLTLDELDGIIPASALSVITDYLEYVSMHNNDAMLTAGVLGMLTTSAAAFRSINNIMADIQGGSRFRGLMGLIFSFIVSLLFLLTIYFALLVIVTGNWLVNLISRYIPIFEEVALWQVLKYPVLFVLFALILGGLYRLTTPKGEKRPITPGTLTAAVVLIIVSIVFSEFISMSSRYPLIYGSLASIIIFMFWLYTCGIVLIMGNTMNYVLAKRRRAAEKTEAESEEKAKEEKTEDKKIVIEIQDEDK